jgi:membrane protein implicated in regulation of membrane protease activity
MSPIFWLWLSLGLLFVELFTLELTCFSLTLGTLAAALSSYFNLGLWTQTASAILIAALSLLFMVPLWRRYLTPKDTASGVEVLIGQKAEVIEEIIPPQSGLVKIHGVNWNVESDTFYKVGDWVEIQAVKNNRLVI